MQIKINLIKLTFRGNTLPNKIHANKIYDNTNEMYQKSVNVWRAINNLIASYLHKREKFNYSISRTKDSFMYQFVV